MKEILRNGLTTAALVVGAHFGSQVIENPVANAMSFLPQPSGNHLILNQDESDYNKSEDEVRKDTAATFIIAAGVLAVTLFSYRMSDGARNDAEKYGWRNGVTRGFTA